jgi:phosphoribosylformylglycinamidine (FGAM) synthase-like amidotransferase family enzyme
MKSAIIVFPGTNRERDMAIALERVSGRKPSMVFHLDTALPAGTDLVVLPGGFSLWRLPALRRDGGAVADHAARWRDFAARGRAWCSACATASRSCAKRGLLPGALLRNAIAALPVQRLPHAGRTQTTSPFTQHYQKGAR